MLEVQKATLDVAGASRLDQIRASLGGQTAVTGGAANPALERPRVRVPPRACERWGDAGSFYYCWSGRSAGWAAGCAVEVGTDGVPSSSAGAAA